MRLILFGITVLSVLTAYAGGERYGRGPSVPGLPFQNPGGFSGSDGGFAIFYSQNSERVAGAIPGGNTNGAMLDLSGYKRDAATQFVQGSIPCGVRVRLRLNQPIVQALPNTRQTIIKRVPISDGATIVLSVHRTDTSTFGAILELHADRDYRVVDTLYNGFLFSSFTALPRPEELAFYVTVLEPIANGSNASGQFGIRCSVERPNPDRARSEWVNPILRSVCNLNHVSHALNFVEPFTATQQ